MSIFTARAWLLSLGILTAMGAASLAWRECVVAAVALVLADRLFLWRTDLGAPWDGLRLGVRCLTAGLLGIAVSSALAALAIAGLADLVAMQHRNASAALVAVIVAVAFVVAVLDRAESRTADLMVAICLIGATWIAYSAYEVGWTAVPCTVTLFIAIVMARKNWQLARIGAEDFLPSGPR